MATKQVSIAGIGTVTLYKRRGNRSMRLSVDARGEVRVSMPPWLPYKAGEQFALGRAAWITSNRTHAKSETLQHGQLIGKAHRLVFEPYLDQPDSARVHSRIARNEIRVRYPASFGAEHQDVQAAAHKASIRALRLEGETLLPQRLQTLATQTGYTYNEVQIKLLKSRWGSCTSRQEIALNLFLMQLPWHLIDYVLVHELVHTKVMRHGEPFWAEFERHVPQAKKLRREIGKHQPVLTPRTNI
jgi:predicted metal-dependent hydrolase